MPDPDALKPVPPEQFVCDGTCAGNEFGDCNHGESNDGLGGKRLAVKTGPQERVRAYYGPQGGRYWEPISHGMDRTDTAVYIRADVHERVVAQLRQVTKAICDTIGNGKTARQMRSALRAALAALPPEAEKEKT